MTQQEKQSIKEKSEKIANIIKGVEKYGFQLSDYEIGYVDGILGRVQKSQNEKGDPTCQNS